MGSGWEPVRSSRWRYISYADGTQVLYDHQTDLNEWTNLASDPAHAAVITDHARFLPKTDVPAVAGSTQRILEQRDGQWWWEGNPITPGEAVP